MESTEQQKFWDEESSAANYFRGYMETISENKWTDMLLSAEKSNHIRVSGSVLEIGGGSQYLSRFVSERKDTHIVCTDISDERIRLSTEYYKSTPSNLRTMGNVNAQKLPFESEQFDFVIGDAVLHHLEDIRSGLYEINRCLKPGGHAIFVREPVLGIDLLLKRAIKRLVFSDYEANKLRFIKENRFEFDKYIVQWSEEFYRTGFTFKTSKGWYYRDWKSVLKSRAPLLFTCLITFCLKKEGKLNLFLTQDITGRPPDPHST